MTKIEEVARAIGCIDADRCPYALSNDKQQREKMGSCEECLAAGKRAIAAMREPSDEMLLEATSVSEGDFRSAYRVMIDKALEE